MAYNYRQLFKGLAQYRAPLNYELVGKKLEILLDGAGSCSFTFLDRETIEMDFLGILQKNSYEALKIDNDVYMLHFELSGQTPRRCISLVYEASLGEVTIFFAKQGHCQEYLPRVEREIYFGAVRQPDGTYPAGRACYTDDLVGKSIDFTYTTVATVRHTYIDPHTFRWEFIAAGKEARGAWQQEYCDFIRVNDHIYIFSWLEKVAGVQGFCVENLDRMYHIGGFFGIGPDNLPECYTMSAYGRPAPFDASEKE